ncbi:MAG: TlpA disulfide reductase family protein [Pseudomonadales bacterium]|jgi:thiol-disulfide isomerase/thioredoxin|nr:TlpA disulfide reductase family protein [Pseudomonadales bacterium]
MRGGTLLLWLVTFILVGTIAIPTAAGAEAIKTVQAPAWRGTDLMNGKQVDFPGVLNGKPAVVLFWATWCSYCKAFMPAVRQIQADYAPQGVQIISLNAKERGRGDPKAYVAGLNFPMVAIADADQIAKQYNVNFIPGLMVVDGDGRLTYRRRSTDLPAGTTVAEQWDGEVRAALDALVGG